MNISEEILFWLAKRLYRTEIAHTSTMKEALSDRSVYNEYRAEQFELIREAINRYQIDLRGKRLIDFGCSDGAITQLYVSEGVTEAIGVDVDECAVESAIDRNTLSNVRFVVSQPAVIQLPDASADVIISYDVFEHVSQPREILAECRRILAPGGKMLIGTWGWYHPFAPHLWSVLPVPWAHVLWSEKTIFRVCRRVYHSAWYVPTMHDLDGNGCKQPDRYNQERISPAYLNKLFIRDFEREFSQSGLTYKIFPQPFGSKWARWSKCLLRTPWLKEFVTAYIWVVLERPTNPPPSKRGRERKVEVTPMLSTTKVR